MRKTCFCFYYYFQYGFVTPITSLVVVKPNETDSSTVQDPLVLPNSRSQQAGSTRQIQLQSVPVPRSTSSTSKRYGTSSPVSASARLMQASHSLPIPSFPSVPRDFRGPEGLLSLPKGNLRMDSTDIRMYHFKLQPIGHTQVETHMPMRMEKLSNSRHGKNLLEVIY